MNDAYDVDGVKVTPLGGGFYELTHSSLTDPVKERGKEAADARATKIAKDAKEAAGNDEAHLQPQGNLDNLGGLQPTLEQLSDDERAAQEQSGQGGKDDDAATIAALQGQLAAEKAARELLEQAAKPIVTVIADQAPVQAAIPATVPREYKGQMDPATKAALKKLGVGVTKIVLEENESIPPTGLFVGHNGRSYMIAPGEEVDVPDFLLNVLNDAVMSAPLVDAKTQKVLGYRNRSKYPYRRV